MPATSSRRHGAALALSLLFVVSSAAARVTSDQAAHLGKELTPEGALAAANAEGTIPAWTGGLREAPLCYPGAGKRYCDPFSDDKPVLAITSSNVDGFRKKLTAGHLALFDKYPDSYRMVVYPTRRSFANPPFVYDASIRNATAAEVSDDGETLSGAATGVPFPMPLNAVQIIWNHKLRWRDVAGERWNNQFAVSATGEINTVKILEDRYAPYSEKSAEPDRLANTLSYLLQRITEPPRLAGTLLLVRETEDTVKEPRGIWQYVPGQHRLKRAPNIAYDFPAAASDGLRTTDQWDMFSGPVDRYDWNLIGRKEIYVPANSYRLHSDKLRYKEIFHRGHIAQDLARYELRRVWIVDSVLKRGADHAYKRRVFYLDEDSWQIVAVDVYDKSDQLIRVQEAHTIQAYDRQFQMPVLETVYDLESGRYLAMGADNEDPEAVARKFDAETFSPAAVAKQASR